MKKCQISNSHTFPKDKFPEPVMHRLMVLSFSVNTRPEFNLFAEISVISMLIGPKTKLGYATIMSLAIRTWCV